MLLHSLRRWIASISILHVHQPNHSGIPTLSWPAVRLDLFIYTANTIKDIWDRGFGQVNPYSVIDAFGINMNVIAAVFIANLPQTIISFLYLLCNAILTSVLSAQEWNTTRTRSPLRVRVSEACTTSNYYTASRLFFSGLLYWITSQAIFLARDSD